jgi:S1-C subfamily serine protease
MSEVTTSNTSESSTLSRVSQELTALDERVGQATVLVDGRGFRPGTGTIVGADLVLTASLVVDQDDKLEVTTADGRALAASLAGRDPANGLALLNVPGLDGKALPPATSAPRIGQLVVAVSRSWEGHQAASLGVVSAVGGPVRVGRGVKLEQVIRADIGVSRGLSGSPLVTVDGEWLGLVHAGLVRGVPLVIPQRIAAQAIATIGARGNAAKRGYLGVALHTVRLPERQRAAGSTVDHGVIIVGISQAGPADRAGLLVGDVIVSAAGTPIADIDDLQALLASAASSTLALDILRGGTPVHADVQVGDRPA